MSTYPIAKLNEGPSEGIFAPMARTELPAWDKIEVGKRITLLRAALDGMEQNVLASAIGITPQKLNNYEKGRNLIPVHETVRLCSVTGANFEYVYRGDMAHLGLNLRSALIGADRPLSTRSRRA